jgi:glutamate-1-semialdehyde 2,1-aminomutase
MAAGCVTLDALARNAPYEKLEALSARLHGGLLEAISGSDVKATINRVGSMITLFFTPGPVTDYASAKTSDTALYARFFHSMLEHGVYFPPAQFEAAFVSLAHSISDVDATVSAAREAFRALRH